MLTNIVPPISTEPLGACNSAADVATKKCIFAQFKFMHLGSEYATSSELTSRKGLINPYPYHNDVAGNSLGIITTGQGDRGLQGAAFGFEFKAKRPFPMASWVDLLMPVGMGYDEVVSNWLIPGSYNTKTHVVENFAGATITKIADAHVRVNGIFIYNKLDAL